ncbi:hypothetical protein BJI69_11135 [Luteibacter rhizovicinus DSM 16549]|uniref:Uncharacterized protein n=1 Tax=Luteibacter rhizovicinus DSM 16549 TaxID=1440763 RepID=A0A0G9GZK5_9GAMM|nr:hypothetical protein [Luteibacter rhizovicinus]APG04396.1 hypothetical protein BJI69_11135 [Luteibacter rhizovicinus DSM 16549]KLD62384.1 hypothetical protein Y883_20580 [Luteibacter rhizovicinus DSM 16549]
MRYLALMLLAPWLIVLGWAYWQYPKALLRNATRRAFDVLALIAAIAAAVQAAIASFDAVVIPAADQFGPKSGAIWQQVVPALWGYGAFVAVLVVALIVRQLVWKHRAPNL